MVTRAGTLISVEANERALVTDRSVAYVSVILQRRENITERETKGK